MDNMEKELWDAFYGKESKQERCSVLTEAELNKHNKGTLKEGFMSDEDINNQYSNFKILDISKEGNKSGYIEVEFPNADDSDYDSYVNTGYIIYDDGTVAFDKWFPEEVYNDLVDAVKNVHENATLDEGCGKKKKKALKENMNSSSPKMKKFGHFNVAVVFPNEKSIGRPRYTNTYGTEVEFYDDNNHEEGFGPYGQFVSSYLLDTLLGKSEYSDNDGIYPYGLQLHGNSPNWTVPAETMSEIIDWLKQFDNETLKESVEYNVPEDIVVAYMIGDTIGDDNFPPSMMRIQKICYDKLGTADTSNVMLLMVDNDKNKWAVIPRDKRSMVKIKKKALKESAEFVYIYVDKPNRHNNNIIVKSDEFGKITYLPNDFEKLEDTIKRAVNDYAAENNIAEYEVIKLYESKKALNEDYEEDEELTPVNADSLGVDEFYNGYVMDNVALWDEDIDYDAMEANKNQIFQYWKQLVKGGEDEWDAVEISVRRFASNEELDEGVKKRISPVSMTGMLKAINKAFDDGKYGSYGEWECGLGGYDTGYQVSYERIPYFEIKSDNSVLFLNKNLMYRKLGLTVEDIMNALSALDEFTIQMDDELDEGCGKKKKKSLKESDEDMSGYEDRLNKTIKSEMKKFPKYAADAKKALDDGDEIKKILNKYNQEYNFLYNNHDKVAGYEEAVRAWDEYINHPDFRELIGKVIKARHDMFTSDREIGALMFALDALGYLDKFDGKESSLEPVVKEFKA